MHMADALLSPAVGAALWTATAVATVTCARKVREKADARLVPLMGVTGAFIFAAQMLNFAIPGTGSSGHLGGGLILAVLLGPQAAFLVIASVLSVQALFFADGGLLALGANIFNLGMLPAFVAYPLVYRLIAGANPRRMRLIAGSVVSAVFGLQLGALAVVLETTLSGVSALPFSAFIALMLPIHLAIGLVEGAVTAAVVLFVAEAQPELLERNVRNTSLAGLNLRSVMAGLGIAAILAGSSFAWFASTDPDGLEWSIERVTGSKELAGNTTAAVHRAAAVLQARTAVFPGYRRRDTALGSDPRGDDSSVERAAVDAEMNTAGVIGAGVTLGVAALVGLVLSRRKR